MISHPPLVLDIQIYQFRHHVSTCTSIFTTYHLFDVLSDVIIEFIAFAFGVNCMTFERLHSVIASEYLAVNGEVIRKVWKLVC